MPATSTFGARLFQLRDDARLSIAELATRSGLTGAAIRYLESGRSQPSWDTVQRLAVAMQVSTEAFRS